MENHYQKIIHFWFNEIDSALWWTKSDEFDALIKNRFGKLHSMAIKGELFHWRSNSEGALAEIIILDQFSRNIYRNDPRSFTYDCMSLTLAQTAIVKKQDLKLSPTQKSFLYLPFMHSESQLIHTEAVKLYTKLDLPGNLDFEMKHKKIIDRFDRYPHRNEILNRISTIEEIEFLKEKGSSF